VRGRPTVLPTDFSLKPRPYVVANQRALELADGGHDPLTRRQGTRSLNVDAAFEFRVLGVLCLSPDGLPSYKGTRRAAGWE
jgi:hypothetical protein